MSRTPTQSKLEVQRGRGIEEILKSSLNAYRGQKHMVTLIALDLGVTDATLYNWCREFGIDVDDYRCPSTSSGARRTGDYSGTSQGPGSSQ